MAARATEATEASAGQESCPNESAPAAVTNATAWGSNNRLTVQEAGKPKTKVRDESSSFAVTWLLGAQK